MKYGPVVRYGPNRLMFSDPGLIPVIFATSNAFEKVRTPLDDGSSSLTDFTIGRFVRRH